MFFVDRLLGDIPLALAQIQVGTRANRELLLKVIEQQERVERQNDQIIILLSRITEIMEEQNLLVRKILGH